MKIHKVQPICNYTKNNDNFKIEILNIKSQHITV